ncbi:glycoside hydrolase family 19 protein [Spirosoma endbachense]|uniref:Glycoside hydrolase family 19 catalytic domain-containing protein n=1 Tax=Spirosoma endbachense TaxID=2666025 RepID=A0A6P1W1G0_9BACT|nr:glycoside hydrolase family 19 protein [Spirosoma endbachense]QHV99243.1 hypothetical protein GJR95_31390 [Spirosoma endbachense]
MKALTVDLLVRCGAVRSGAEKYVALLNELLPYYKITTHLRVSHFLAQVLHECDSMKTAEEYASGAAYEGREDLGNSEPGDGMRFKGRGLIQLTGRKNYAAFAEKFGVDCMNHPELIAEPRWAVASALNFWNVNKLNGWADMDRVYQISCLINIGHIPLPNEKRQFPNGWVERQALVRRCKGVLAEMF